VLARWWRRADYLFGGGAVVGSDQVEAHVDSGGHAAEVRISPSST
jgi:hypothetical protein